MKKIKQLIAFGYCLIHDYFTNREERHSIFDGMIICNILISLVCFIVNLPISIKDCIQKIVLLKTDGIPEELLFTGYNDLLYNRCFSFVMLLFIITIIRGLIIAIKNDGYEVIKSLYSFALYMGGLLLLCIIGNLPYIIIKLVKGVFYVIIIAIICFIAFLNSMVPSDSENSPEVKARKQRKNDSLSKQQRKNRERIKLLQQSNKDYAEYNNRQLNGDIGYQYFEIEKNMQIMKDQKQEIEQMEKENAKLESKKEEL